MKNLFSIIIMFAVLIGTLYADNYSAPKREATVDRNTDGCKYSVSTSTSDLEGLPSGYVFDTRIPVSATPVGVQAEYTSNSQAIGELAYSNSKLPGSDFIISMSGALIPPEGKGGGSQPTWSAEFGAKAPLVISPKEAAGASATFSTSRSGQAVDSGWNMPTGASSDKITGESITVTAAEAGEYQIEAVNEQEKAHAVFTRLKVVFKDRNATEVSACKLVIGGSVTLLTTYAPLSVVNKYPVTLAASGGGLTIQGSVPGEISIGSSATEIGNGDVLVKYKTQTIASLNVELVKAKISLIIVP